MDGLLCFVRQQALGGQAGFPICHTQCSYSYLRNLLLDFNLLCVPLVDSVTFHCTVEKHDELHVRGVASLHHVVEEMHHAIPLASTDPVRVVAAIEPIQAALCIHDHMEARVLEAPASQRSTSLLQLLLSVFPRKLEQVNRLACLGTFLLDKLLQMLDTHGDSECNAVYRMKRLRLPHDAAQAKSEWEEINYQNQPVSER